MKRFASVVVLALLLGSARGRAQATPHSAVPAVSSDVEIRLESCDQLQRDIAAAKRSIDASGPDGVSRSDDLRARTLIGNARRAIVEASVRTDSPSATTLKEMLVYTPKLIDALMRVNPADSSSRLLADGTTRVATLVDSAGLEAASHALNILADSLELASSPQNAGDLGWKTADAGKEQGELIKGVADYVLLIGKDHLLEQVIDSGLIILSETHSFDSAQIRTVSQITHQQDLTDRQREEAESDLQLIEEADQRIEALHGAIQTELQQRATIHDSATPVLTTPEVLAVPSSDDQPASSEVEPPPSAPELPESTTLSGSQHVDPADSQMNDSESVESDSQTASPEGEASQTNETEQTPAADEAGSHTNERGDEAADAPFDDQEEATPADVEADQAETPPDVSNDSPSTKEDPDREPNQDEVQPDDSSQPGESTTTVDPDAPASPPADAPHEETPDPPPPAPPSR